MVDITRYGNFKKRCNAFKAKGSPHYIENIVEDLLITSFKQFMSVYLRGYYT